MTEDTLKRIRQDVQDKPWFLVYDNINFASRKLDQRIDNADAYESGTTATVVMMDDYITSDCIKSSYQHLHLDDLIPDEDSVEHIKALSEKALIDVLMRSSKTFEVCRRSPPTLQPLKPAKTITHPLPSMLINQATVAGNLEVLNTVMEQTLQLRQNWFDEDRTIVVAGDQLTVSRVSTVKEYKAIDVSPYHRLQYALPMLQLFHLKMAFCKLIMETHWGSPTQPGSLQFNKLLLRRKRVLPTNFDFHAADELLRHTFEAIVRRIWEVALDSTNLAEPVHGMSDGDIQDLVSEKVMDFMNDLLAPFPEDTDRFSRSNRNTALLLRHILIYLELCASIKNGDIGRIEEILKWITIMFQNGTNNNYGLELLHIHCAIRHVWTAEMKNKILGTWLVNTNGNENGWIPTDMYQEHNNKLIKAVYAAKGSNASWDTLASSISVNIRTFSVIKKQFENCFNRSHNSGHHSIVSAEADIEMILLSLRNAGIFGENVGTGDHDIEVALDKDLYASGLSFLSESRIDDFRKVGLSEDIDKVENEEQLEDPFL